jgi:serine/threonine protein kinase/tetratricopeptide (TPR) repeat protein
VVCSHIPNSPAPSARILEEESIPMPDPIPSRPSADRNLLFGILALQMDFINRDALVGAMHAWVLAKDKPLGQILIEQGKLGREEHGLLDALVQKHLQKHNNDPAQSLAAVSSLGSVEQSLRQIADPDVSASLGHVPPMNTVPPVDHYATRAPSVTPSTAGGPRFRILRPHAHGGLGEVFVALDDELHREVALKEIKDRFADDPESRARFVLEAEITGGLEHPGIVPVYGLGHYAEGRPFYAMRFIRGDSLMSAIEQFHAADAAPQTPGQRTLALRELLGRFVDVCHAIEYAHSRGVLHRDLKPGNIILGNYGETLVVDWGLAKPLDQAPAVNDSMEAPLRPPSLSGSVSQTQAGAVLGTPQYMSPEQAHGRLDILGPASDVYSLGATLYCLLTGKPPFTDTDISVVLLRVRQGKFPAPRQVKPDLPPPLEAICLKAMALRTADRYPTPHALAKDVERWLADEPVSAWREPWHIKTRRWIGRHRPLVAGVAAAVLVATVSLAIGAVLLLQANAALRAANQRERDAKELAEHNYQFARKAVDRYHTEVSNDVLLNEPGMQPLRKKLLEAAREFYEQFVQERGEDKGTRAELGHAYFRLAQITADLDAPPKAIELHEHGRQIFTALADEHPGSADEKSDLAASWHHLGRLQRLTDQLTKSEEAYRKALGLWEELAREQPENERFQAELARSRLGLGNVCKLTRRLDEAQKLFEQALSTRRDLHGRHLDVAEYQRDLAVALNNLAMVHATAGRTDRAVECDREAATLQEKLSKVAPHISQYQDDLARSEYNLGDWHTQANHADQAEAAYREAVTLWQRLADKHPAVLDFQVRLAEAMLGQAKALRLASQTARAEEICAEAVAREEKLAGEHKDLPHYQGKLARGYFQLAEIHRSAKRDAKAEEFYEKAVPIQEKLVHDLPGSPEYAEDLARTCNNLGLLRRARGQEDRALASFRQAATAWEVVLRAQPAEPVACLGLATTCNSVGSLLKKQGKPAESLDWHTRAVRALEALPADMQGRGAVRAALCSSLWQRAQAQDELRHPREALADWDRALALGSPANEGFLRLYHALALARAGEHAKATAEAEALASKATGPGDFYLLAQVFALSVVAAKADGTLEGDARTNVSEDYAGRGIELLDRARAVGFFKEPANLEKLQKDTELDSLRPRKRFTVVLRAAEQESSTPP